MKKRSLAFKLVAGGIAVVLIPLSVVGLFSLTKASKALDTLSKEQATNIAKDLAAMTQLVLTEEVKLAKNLSVEGAIVDAATTVAEAGEQNAAQVVERLNAELLKAMEHIGKDYESILVTDAKGSVIGDGSNGGYKGVSLADREYFSLAKNGKVNVATPVKSKLTGLPVIPVCAPVLSSEGACVGTVTTVVKIDFLSEKFASVKVGQTGYPFMVDTTGLTIVHPNPKHILETNLAKLPGMESIMSKMLAQQAGVDSYVFEGIHKIAGYAPVELTQWAIGVTQPSEEFMAAAHAIRNVILIVGALFLAGTILGVLFFARGITRPIMGAVRQMNEGADQVASAAGQVSAASQSLAEGASESAASLEETSSSLEEMSSMTKQNAENANQADELMKQANDAVNTADEAMTRLTGSMGEISHASEETQKIIKTIDEIAFQTNLLALNAAVEAARAGEAGAGFAVVADEVRNLAMRAADAAKNTAGLIEDTVNKVKDGTELVKGTNEAFTEVSTNATKVGELVAEIAAASNEQAQGIDQINKAATEMDQVTQQNAANAEESASASEELNAQAEQMRSVVEGLVAIIGGNAANGNDRNQKLMEKKRASITGSGKPMGGGLRAASKKVSPEQVIPMDDEEFKDF